MSKEAIDYKFFVHIEATVTEVVATSQADAEGRIESILEGIDNIDYHIEAEKAE